jgi:diacylglycerol kinase family enzyme
VNAPKPDIRVILNVGSGKRRGEALVEELREQFDRYPGRFDLVQVNPGMDIPGEARRAVEEGFATVVACGGDGTISGVAQGVAGTEARMGVLSFGTFNYFARSLGLPESVEDKVRVLIEGEPRAITIGAVNGKVFLNNASLGAYSRILERREDIYKRFGRSRIAAFWSVFSTLADNRAPMVLRVTVDGEVRRARTPLVFVASNAYQLEEFGLAGADCVRDGQFALFLAPDGSPLALIGHALRLGLRRLKPERDFELVCGREIVVESAKHHRLVARDGERSKMEAPFRFEARDEGLTVLVPKSAEHSEESSDEKVA